MKITDHYDHFFKTVFTDKENAVDFITGVFPKHLKNILKLSTLKIAESSFIDNKLKEHLSDVIYECETINGKQTYITILFEHKSFVPQHPHIQLLRYLTGIWELQLKQKRRITPVIPVIVYHGKDRWIKRDFKNSFVEYEKDFFPYIPAFDYLLIDLSELTDNEIKNKLFTQTALRIGLLIQKNIFNTEILQKHLKDYIILDKLYYREEKGIQFLESLLRYLSYASDISFNDVERSTVALPEHGREIFMTLAQQLIERGIEQGEIIDKQNVLIKQISKKFGVSDQEKVTIREMDSPELLDAALDVILFAKSKAEVMGALEEQ